MNEDKDLWQKNKWILYVVIVAIIASFTLHKCNNSEPNIKTVIVPEKKGETVFHDIKNTPIKKDTILLNSTKWYENKKKDIFLQSEIDKLIFENESQQNDFNKLFEKSNIKNDSLQKLLYAQAIELNSFHEIVDNDTIKIDAYGITQGKLKTLKLDWKIKASTIEVKNKQTIFALKTGVEFGNTLQFNQPVFKGNIEFENKKGYSFSYGYDTNQIHWIGAKITVFDIKR